jgi:hypothetical protein
VNQQKQSTNDRSRRRALAIQDKLIWDLSFAMKRCLVEEKWQTTLKGIAIAQLPVQSLLDCAETEDPQPETWHRWIKNKYGEHIT